MNIKELAEKCEEINIDCDICEYRKECARFEILVEELSPYGFLNLSKNMERYKLN